MMKSWHSLIRKFKGWRRKYQYYSSWLWSLDFRRLTSSLFVDKLSLSRYRPKKNAIKLRNFLFVLIFSIISLTSVVGYRFYNQPQLTVGKIAPVTIKAPHTAQFEDTKTTLEKRQEVQTGIIPILKRNESLTHEITDNLAAYLESVDRLRNLTEPFPFYDPQALSISSQKYIRLCPESEFQAILASVDENYTEKNLALENSPNFNVQLQRVATELKAYRAITSTSNFNTLIAQITLTRHRYAQALRKLPRKKVTYFNEQEMILLLDLTEKDWQTTKSTMSLAVNRILAQGIAEGIPSNVLEQAVIAQISPDIPTTTASFACNLLLEILKPNLEVDRDATRNIAEKAAMAINSVIVEINQGEVIVEKGARISQADFVLLDGFKLSQRAFNWLGLRLSASFVCAIIGLFLLVQRQVHTHLRHRDYLLLCLLSLTAPLLSVFEIPHSSLPAIGLLVSSFYSPVLGVCEVLLVTALVIFSTQPLNSAYLFAACIGGLIAAVFAGKLRSREAMAKLGIMVGLAQLLVYLSSNLMVSASPTTIWSAILPDALNCGLFGVVWSVIAIGISPYLERFFDLITPIRLAELSNPNLPLLKRLATETPGTFQHTMFVASLAETAARELNCNVELVRAGTLYHDIGKMHDPLSFIENQMDGVNKHDRINDPWISAEIIKKHVTQGLVIARKYRLPKAIRDFIPEHQGTLLIAYFYHQAQQQAQLEGKAVLESDFRYVGPIPQSRESGLLMLADGSEAALRSLKDVSHKQAITTIQKIFKSRWHDGQLSDSGISYDELPIIAEIFVRVWQQFNHKRIIYPKAALEIKPNHPQD